MALIGKVVSEKMFENNDHIHEYCPRTGTDNPREVHFIIKIFFCQFGHLLQDLLQQKMVKLAVNLLQQKTFKLAVNLLQ